MKTAALGLVGMLITGLSIAEPNLAGDWIGKMNMAGKAVPLWIHLDVKDKTATGTVSLPTERLEDQPLSDLRFESGALHFEVKKGDVAWIYDSKLQANMLKGTFHVKDISGAFDLIRLAPLADATYHKYFGIYQFDSNRFLYVRTWDELGKKQLTYFHSSGQIGALHPLTETEYFVGPSLFIPTPRTEQVRFGKDKGVEGLWFTENEKPAEFARKIQPYSEQEVRFQNGAVTLAGTLLIPSTPGKHPGVVLVHGSSSVTRDFMGPIAYDFVRKGIAVLSYDKRGVGESGGHWMDSSYQDLAEDALAALNLLKSKNEIDATRIGLFGISQGGWLGPLAASQSKDISFLVLVSAPGITPGQQIAVSQEAEMKAMQIPEKDVAAATAELNAQLDWLRSQEAATDLQDKLKKLREQPDATLLTSQSLDNPRYLLWLKSVLDYDPIPPLQKTTCPVLLVYGELDRTVPYKESMDAILRTFKNSGNQKVTTKIFPKGNHALMLSDNGTTAEFFYLREFVPGFFDSITTWILKLQ